MSTLRRFLALFAAVGVVAVLATGCDSDAEPTPDPTTPDPSATEDPSGPIAGKYLYANAGLRATVEFDGNAGQLDISNKTGRELPEPFLYVRAADDGAQVDGKVVGAKPIPDGKNESFRFEFPPEVDPSTIGLLFLVLGEDDYGAFIPPAASG
ncbi:MAG: hypothetical protein WEA10_10480 [Actinomycetota bacterium]